MAINLMCPQCKKTHSLEAKLCSCGNSLRTNRKYRVRVRLSTGKWLSKQVVNITLAQKVEAKFRIQATEADVLNIPHKVLTLEQVWSIYLKWAKNNKRSWKGDLSRWTHHISPHNIVKLKMNRVTPAHIQMVLDQMTDSLSHRGTPFKPATVKQVLVLLKRIFNFAIKRKIYFGANPANKIELASFDNKVTNTLSGTNFKKLMEVLNSDRNERAVLIIKFGLYSGRRRGELLNLKWSGVNLREGLVTYKGSNAKNKDTQTIPINNGCLAVLKRAAELKVSELVFPCQTGKYYHSFSRTWVRIRNKAELGNFRFHDLRHTFASELASTGEVDIYTLQNLLGHKSLAMTQRYAHLIDGALRKAANVADNIFKVAGGQ